MVSMLSEIYKNRIKLLSGIISESKIDIMTNTLYIPEKLAKEINDGYGRYSMWVANSFMEEVDVKREELQRHHPELDAVSSSEFKNLLKGKDSNAIEWLNEEWDYLEAEYYEYIKDWLIGRGTGPVIENDKLDFRRLSLEEAYRRAEAWHKELSKIKSGKIEDEYGDVVMPLKNGYYWIRLNKSYCDKEAAAMGHCGRGSGILYSLRKNKHSFVTADINKNGIVTQMRGKANTKPKKKYHDYIFDFIMSDIVNHFDYASYRDTENFYISDLDDNSKIKQIIENKPKLLKGQSLEGFGDDDILSILENEPEIIPLSSIFNDLSVENIDNELSSELWWKDISDKHKWNPLKSVISDFKKSGDLFYNIFLKKIKEDESFQDFLIFNKYRPDISDNYLNDKILESIKNIKEIGKIGDNVLKDVFIKSTRAINYFWKNNKLYNYINFLGMVEIFGNEGIEKAIKLMKNSKFKSKYIKEKGKAEYNLALDVLEDTI